MNDFDTIWTNAKIATMMDYYVIDGYVTNDYGIIDNAAIAIKNGKIAFVGKATQIQSKTAKQVNDVNHSLITPGLIDCHTHVVYAGNRSDEFEAILNGTSYSQIANQGGGIYSTVKEVRRATEDELLKSSIYRVKNLIREGVTTIEIKSGYGLDLESERKMLKVAQSISKTLPITVKTTFLGAHTCPKEYKGKEDAYIDLVCEEMLPTLYGEGLIDAVDIFCENIGFNLEQTKKVFDSANRLNIPIKVHAEQLSNMGASKLAAKYNALSSEHLEYIDEQGVQAMKESNMIAVILPLAYYFLREKCTPPIDLFRKYGVSMAVSTDTNPGTAPIASILMAMNMASVLFRMTPLEVLQGVTCNAAKALGLKQQVGLIKEGYDADFIVWDEVNPASLIYKYPSKILMRVKSGEITNLGTAE